MCDTAPTPYNDFTRRRTFHEPIPRSRPAGLRHQLHWQSRWERADARFSRVAMPDWDRAFRNGWCLALDRAVEAARGPVLIAGHSLGTLTTAWWATRYARPAAPPKCAALLVALPDPDGPRFRPPRTASPVPYERLPFPTCVVASSDDPYARSRSPDTARMHGQRLPRHRPARPHQRGQRAGRLARGARLARRARPSRLTDRLIARGGAAVEAAATPAVRTRTTRRVQIACFARSAAIFASS